MCVCRDKFISRDRRSGQPGSVPRRPVRVQPAIQTGVDMQFPSPIPGGSCWVAADERTAAGESGVRNGGGAIRHGGGFPRVGG